MPRSNVAPKVKRTHTQKAPDRLPLDASLLYRYTDKGIGSAGELAKQSCANHCMPQRKRDIDMRAIRYQAAGGVVVDGDRGAAIDSRRVLVLRRPSRDEVRLPKGHMKKGELPGETALREVTEESSYADLEILADLGHQVVEFDYQDVHVVRDEYYFLMRLRNAQQVEREDKDLQFIPDWLDWDEALSELTFEAEREWVRRAREYAP
jgi:8-oxo-dGTP pyrophosphatase MutT (NUDIX family)